MPQITSCDGDKYYVVSIHFHWGPNDTVGSEHTVGGETFALEMHIVHANVNYDLEDAVNHFDGFLVIGLIFEATSASTV